VRAERSEGGLCMQEGGLCVRDGKHMARGWEPITHNGDLDRVGRQVVLTRYERGELRVDLLVRVVGPAADEQRRVT
jgi:hypothetical protein